MELATCKEVARVPLLRNHQHVQGRRNEIQSGGATEHFKVLSATMVGRQENFLNSSHSRMAKTVTF